MTTEQNAHTRIVTKGAKYEPGGSTSRCGPGRVKGRFWVSSTEPCDRHPREKLDTRTLVVFSRKASVRVMIPSSWQRLNYGGRSTSATSLVQCQVLNIWQRVIHDCLLYKTVAWEKPAYSHMGKKKWRFGSAVGVSCCVCVCV